MMIGTRIGVGIAAGLLVLIGVVGGISLAIREATGVPVGNESAAIAGLATCGLYLLCGAPALVAIARPGGRGKWRRAGIIANSVIFGTLGLAVLGTLVAALFSADTHEREDRLLATGVICLTGGAVAVLNLVCIGGLVRLKRFGQETQHGEAGTVGRRKPVSGGAVAFWVVALGLVGTISVGAGLTVSAMNAKYRRERFGPEPGAISRSTRRPPGIERFPEKNFEFRMPDWPWVKADPKSFKAGSEASLLLINKRAERYVVAMCESLEEEFGIDNQGYRTLVIASTQSILESLSAGEATPRTVAGVEGLTWPAKAKIATQEIMYLNWIGVRKGRAYRLIVWGKASDESGVHEAMEDAMERFSLIDPDAELEPIATAGSSAALEMPAYGLRLELEGSGWTSWEDVKDKSAFAAVGARRGSSAAMIVVPIRLGGLDPHPDALALVLLETMEFKFPSSSITFAGSFDKDDVHGRRFTGTRKGSGRNSFEYRFRVLRRGDVAWLAAAWHISGGDPDNLEAMLDRVVWLPVTTGEPYPAIPDEDRIRHARVINSLGVNYFERSQMAKAAQACRMAAEFDPADGPTTINAVNALIELDQEKEALAFLTPRLERLNGAHDAGMIHANLLAHTGDAPAAIEAFSAEFTGGRRDEKHLDTYIRLLIDTTDFARAEADLDRFTDGGAAAHRTLLAAIRRGQERTEEAVAILREGLDAVPLDTAAASDLLELLDDQERYTEVVEVCERLEQAGVASSWTLFYKGAAEFELDRLPAAKTTLMAALALRPGERAIKDLIDRVAARLGQGDTTAIRTPIEPVPLPAEVLADIPAFAPDAGAIIEHRTTAILFEPGKTWRKTERYTVRVVDRRGLDAINSFTFEFHPLYERIFVNTLEVRDEAGQVVLTGDINTYYVADESGSEHASGTRVLHIPIGALAPGRTLTLTVTTEDLAPAREFQYTDHLLVSTLPTRRSALVVYADPSLIQRLASPGVTVAATQGGTIFTVDSRPAWRSERNQPDTDTFVPWVRLCAAGKTWEQVAQEYLGRLGPRLEPSPAVTELAGRLTAGLESPEEKLHAIARHVQEEYTYKALAFGPRAQIPPPVADTLANHYGDCKDHSFLAHLLLKEAGVESRLALVASSSTIQESIPSNAQFDHMIVYLPDSDRFLDLTQKETDPLLSPPAGLAGRRALIIDQDRPTLAAIPAHPADAGAIDSVRDVRLEGRDLVVDETLTFAGLAAGMMRATARRPADELIESIGLKLGSIGAEVRSAAAENADNTAAPLILRMSYVLPGAFIDAGSGAAGGRLAGTIPFFWERRIFGTDFARDRGTPFEFGHEINLRSTVRVHTGPGLAALPPAALNFDLTGELARATSRVETSDGVTTIKAEFWVGSGRFPPEKYGPHAEFTSRVLGVLEKGLVLERR